MSKLILIRHGQSVWNAENRFTGWVDVDLSEQGILEARKSGQLIKDLNISIDTSQDLRYSLNCSSPIFFLVSSLFKPVNDP